MTVVKDDPLSKHLTTYLSRTGLILEGGCGLGQYVIYLRERGFDVIGGDFSLNALYAHKRHVADTPLVALDLRHLPLADGQLAGHVSLGVVEHLEEGPQSILREIYRTLAPGGLLLLSVPWVNGSRRLLASLIRRRQARYEAAGAAFYQYAYSQREITAFLKEGGFMVRAFHPYSPARGMREYAPLRWLYRRFKAERPLSSPVASTSPMLMSLGWVSLLRRLLYTRPLLRAFAHMILAVAQKPMADVASS